MKALQITLFVLANVIFITQSGRHVHQLFFGVHKSALNEFSPETEKARSEKHLDTLISDYRGVHQEIRALEAGKKRAEIEEVRQSRRDVYQREDALRDEIVERERRERELRDLLIFSGFGSALICMGVALYRSRILWPGFSLLITGFVVLEYWSSPTFFGGAVAEYHSLLVGKILLTLLSLLFLYGFWLIKGAPQPSEPQTPTDRG